MNNTLKVGVCSDHAGYQMKKIVKQWLIEHSYAVCDYGTHNEESCDYPEYAHPLASAVEDGTCSIGVSLCGSGNGIAMTLNKHQGIRAALCWEPELASLARQHNDANVLSLPARFISDEKAIEILTAFFNGSFEGGRHIARINKMPLDAND